eukprot:g12731.t1
MNRVATLGELVLLCWHFCLTVSKATLFTPAFTGPLPDPSKLLGGYKKIPHLFPAINVAYGDENIGKYNHNVMLNYQLDFGFYVYWKNGILTEDSNGQRILFSASKSGQDSWSSPGILFPNLTIGDIAASLEPSPPIQVNGRVYATASPAFINYTLKDLHVAQGAQCQMWPDPVDPRNCGPAAPYAVEYKHTLLLRRIYSNYSLGNMFWGSSKAPSIFATQTRTFGILTFDQMDDVTYKDLKTYLQPRNIDPPCHTPLTGSHKCDWCKGGCMLYSKIPFELKIANERSHYVYKFNDEGHDHEGDILLYRSGNEDYVLYASIRTNSSFKQSEWQGLFETNIPNVNSNLDTGILNNEKIYLLHNPIVRDHGTLHRDPLCLSTSKDGGRNFDKIGVALTCLDLRRGNYSSSCSPAFNHNVNHGVSYPQGLSVTHPAPEAHQGFYVAASNNKEDIWFVKLDITDA